jgi:phosphoglycerate kinase
MIKSIDDTSFESKRVLIRVDFNVPLTDEFKVADDTRIIESLQTIDKILDDGGIPVLMSHLGRPKGEKNMKFSLKPVADYLINKLGYKVLFAEDCIGDIPKDAIKKAIPGEVVLLENLRFYKEEEKNSVEFASKLAELGDCYVNDAFGTAHRAHASTHALALMFTERFAGYLMLKEIKYLGTALKNPKKPYVAVLGGVKISGKIDVIRNLFEQCNTILIGGGMAYTFFKSLGYEIGDSIVENDKVELASQLLIEAESKGVNLLLPSDVLAADSFSNDANRKLMACNEIKQGWQGLDIGDNTIVRYSNIIKSAKTVVWNGPMGVFEFDNFSNGTARIAEALAEATVNGAITVVGGGDSASAAHKLGFSDKVSHISTGGGASLEYLEGKELPGIKALEL